MSMFETCMNQLVKITVNRPVDIGFFNGTMFVDGLTQEEADTLHKVVYEAYCKTYNADVIMNHFNGTNEYAFDFC